MIISKILKARITILSRRRPGEVVRAVILHYSTVDKNDEMAALKESILNDSQKKAVVNYTYFMYQEKHCYCFSAH